MTDLLIDVTEWLGATADVEDATFGSLLVRLQGIPLTEVHDSRGQTTRPTIRVPAVRVAEWLVANYWRLRWEPSPRAPDLSWRQAHSLAGLGGGYAWPALEISGDGEMVELVLESEARADAAAIRYVREARLEVTGAEFDAALERFFACVENRIKTTVPADTSFHELREELRIERTDPELAHWCRLEARAGIDSGEASASWREAVEQIQEDAGRLATEDMLAAAAVGDVAKRVQAMMSSGITVDLSSVSPVEPTAGRPWERGVAAARALRGSLGLPEGPLPNSRLASVLGLAIPVDTALVPPAPFVGAYRPPGSGAQTKALVPKRRASGQRFYFARLLGAATIMPWSEAVLPITDARTAFQKMTRSFAQELLLPWAELDAWTDEHGTDEDSIALAADRYQVSELLVSTTLVNRGKLVRDRLAAYSV